MVYCIEENGNLRDQPGPFTVFTINVVSSDTSGQVLDLSAVYCSPHQTRRIHFYGATGGAVANLIGDALKPGMVGVDAAFILSLMLEAGPAATMISIPRRRGEGFLESLNAALKDAATQSGIAQGPVLAAMPLFGSDTLKLFSSFSEVVNGLDPNGGLHVLATPFCSEEEGVIRVALFSRVHACSGAWPSHECVDVACDGVL